ncbi:MAG TPA: hypothetical protein VFC65_05950 [Prolixibacteraceae bacterium]|nr:hypothetical protein [Prolixibacteraceae bacterium]
MKQNSADKKSINYFLMKLNGFLEADQFDIGKFGNTLMRFEKRFNPIIGIIDFNYFDERRLNKAHRGKQKGEQIQNFQYARSQRYLERVCQQHVELKTLIGIEKSIFLFEENFLLFCHFRTSKNDREILQWIFLDERYVKLNIRV